MCCIQFPLPSVIPLCFHPDISFTFPATYLYIYLSMSSSFQKLSSFPSLPRVFPPCVLQRSCVQAGAVMEGEMEGWREAQKRGAGNLLIISKTERELRASTCPLAFQVGQTSWRSQFSPPQGESVCVYCVYWLLFQPPTLTTILRPSSLSFVHTNPIPQPQLLYPKGVSCCIWHENKSYFQEKKFVIYRTSLEAAHMGKYLIRPSCFMMVTIACKQTILQGIEVVKGGWNTANSHSMSHSKQILNMLVPHTQSHSFWSTRWKGDFSA